MDNIAAAPLTLALIGAGLAGRSLAAQAVRAGHRVVLEDVLPSKLRDALAEIETAGMPGTLVTVTTIEDAVREADLVVEFMPDELESKLEIACMVDRMAPPKSVLCLQTRVLSIGDLASCTYRADRCIAVQLGADEALLVRGAKTTDETAQLVERFWRSVCAQVTVREEVLV